MLFKANAKINLALDVLGERPNGYHDVKMIMQSVDLADYLEINPNDENRIIINCDNNEIECNESNLIYKAATKIMDYVGKSFGVTIKLEKNIPIAAGMAGGSTDAAATLVGINEVMGLGLSSKELRDIGVTFGADIPFCIEGGTYLSEGIGEILTKLPDMPECILLIAKPDINVSTKFVYDNLVLDETTIHPDVDGMIEAIKKGSLTGVTGRMSNLLATVTEQEYKVIKRLKDICLEEGALGSLMSGSGPTVFGVFDEMKDAKMAYAAIKNELGLGQVYITVPAKAGIEIMKVTKHNG